MEFKLLQVFAFVLEILLFLHLSLAQSNYCDPTICRNKPHIACNNNGAFASACASNAKIVTLTAAQRTKILSRHNTLRNTVAKGGFGVYKAAIRMAKLQWDAELAKLAVFNVKQCKMEHDKCRSTSAFNYAGQNLAVLSSSGTLKTVDEVNIQLINSWFNEHKDCSMKFINAYGNPSSGKAIGHFTQLVAEKATHVGCAVLRHTKGGKSYHYLACNYAYTNVNAKPVYRTGTKAGSACTTGTDSTYKFLCSIKEKYEVNNLSKY